MTRITVLGGTGYAGSAVVAEAAARGHDVVAFSRRATEETHDKVVSVTGSALKREDLELAVADSEVVVCALAAVGELEEDEFPYDAMYRLWGRYSRYGITGNPNVLGWLLGRPPTTLREYVTRELRAA